VLQQFFPVNRIFLATFASHTFDSRGLNQPFLETLFLYLLFNKCLLIEGMYFFQILADYLKIIFSTKTLATNYFLLWFFLFFATIPTLS